MAIDVINTSNGHEYCYNGSSEHDLIVLLPLGIETLRKRLAKALEKLDYRVIDEQPLSAKRDASAGGKYFTSTNALDYPVKLTIGLKAMDADNTKAFFNYELKYPMMGKAEQHLISLEVKALCALANQAEATNSCLSCGTAATSDSRFCRRCGALLELPEPSELEVLRLTAKTKDSYDYLLFGNVCIAIALACLLAVGFVPDMKPKLFNLLRIFGAIAASGFVINLIWTNRLRNLIHGKTSVKEKKEIHTKEIFMLPPKKSQFTYNFDASNNIGRKTGELAYKPAPPSITEHTTDLLPPERKIN